MTITFPSTPGFLLVNKPTGCTSFDVIRSLRRITKVQRIGHTGTLDPFASGLLICCLGAFTRLASLIEAYDKTYQAIIKLGEQTDTGDPTGTVIAYDSFIPNHSLMNSLPDQVLGISALPVPIYSAVKVNGKRAYKYARQDLEITLPIKPMKVYEFEIIKYDYPFLEYRCRVSKGTFIRSLSEWIASQLGTVGHTLALERTAIGKSQLPESVSLSDLSETNWQDKTADPMQLFDAQKIISLHASEVTLLLKGMSISVNDDRNGDVLVIDDDHKIRSYGFISGGILKPRVNLQ